MFSVNRNPSARIFPAPRLKSLLRALPFTFTAFVAFAGFALFGSPLTRAQENRKPPKGGIADLSSIGAQKHQGDVTIADDAVDIHYGNQRLRADHVEYNDQTNEAYARGHIIFDYENQHIEADEAHYNVSTGRGTFTNVRGFIRIERKPNPTVLITDNPLYFEAKNVEKYNTDLYILTSAWITVCDPEHPRWQFFAQHARVTVDKKAALVNANFRLLRVPLIWLPYATAPAGEKVRESGFLLPVIGNSSSKGFVFGDAFYWAPNPWMDTTIGAELLSRRGSAERGHFRAKPWENTSIDYTYFGVIDRGVPTVVNRRAAESNHRTSLAGRPRAAAGSHLQSQKQLALRHRLERALLAHLPTRVRRQFRRRHQFRNSQLDFSHAQFRRLQLRRRRAQRQ